MAKARRKRGRGLGNYTPSEVRARIVRVGEDVDAGDCGAAFQSVRNLESAIAKSPQGPGYGPVLHDYGNVVRHFADRCLVKRPRK